MWHHCVSAVGQCWGKDMGLLLFGNVTGIVWLEQCPQLFQGEDMCISSGAVLGEGYGLTIVSECYRHGLVGAMPFENVSILQCSFIHSSIFTWRSVPTSVVHVPPCFFMKAIN